MNSAGEAHVAPTPLRNTGRSIRRVAVATSLGLTAALLMSGCGSSATPSAKSSTPSAAASSTDPNAAAKADVLDVYRKMWAAQVQVYSTGNLNNPDLQKYAHDKALAKINDTAFYYQHYNAVMKGQPALSPNVTAISTQTQPYSATITDCVDTTHFVEVDKTTGKPVPLIDHKTRHVATYDARTLSGKWLIFDFAIDRDRTC